VVKALKVLGKDVGGDEDITLAEAALLLVSRSGQAKELWRKLRGWRLQILVELIADRIEAANRTVAGLSKDEALLVKLINRYRRVLGRLPLLIDKRLCRAARRHAREMRRLGYFGHVSPVEGRATPLDRARAEGFRGTVGENIFKGGGPVEALAAWQTSEDHNRNMLGGWDPLVIKSGKNIKVMGCPWSVLGVGADEAFVALFGVRMRKSRSYPPSPSSR